MEDGFDTKMHPDRQMELWDCWEFSDHVYEGICEYYANDESVTYYTKEDDCDSEYEVDSDDE